MQIISANSYKEKPNKECVTVLGNFDGVHLGHAQLIRTAKKLADENGYLLCVYTFYEHPASLKGNTARFLTTNEEKAELVELLGADILFMDSFCDVKDFSSEQFCLEVLVKKLNTKIAVCGENFRYGKGRCGTPETLCEEMKNLSGDAVVVDLKRENGDVINSTAIRGLISEGKTLDAMELMGRPYFFTAEVVHGRHLARHLGAPTINQTIPEGKAVPQGGVYAVALSVDGERYTGVANVGTKPTVTSDEKDPPVICETHIINYKGDLYGKKIKTEFYKKLREEKKFSSLEELSAAIGENILQAKEYFEREGKTDEK